MPSKQSKKKSTDRRAWLAAADVADDAPDSTNDSAGATSCGVAESLDTCGAPPDTPASDNVGDDQGPNQVVPNAVSDCAGATSLVDDDARESDTSPALVADVSSASLATAAPAPSSIRDLHPFLDDNWVLHARVIACGEPISWSTERSHGKRLCVYLIDGNGDTIKATIFNGAITSFLPLLTPGSCCSFANGHVKFANRAFSRDPHDLNFDDRSAIVRAPASSIPTASLQSCTRIGGIGQLPNKTVVTSLAVVLRIGPEKRIATKRGQDTSKRELLVVDESREQIVCVLWGGHAKEDVSPYLRSPVLIRHADVNDYADTRSLNAGPHTAVLFEPPLDEAATLMTWFETADVTSFTFVRPPIIQ